MSDKFTEFAKSIRRDLEIEYGVRFEKPVAITSPIEEAVFWALIYMSAYDTRPEVTDEWFDVGSNWRRFRFVPQATVTARGSRYRADFLVHAGERSFIVECDGHDFHERTKEQATRDRKRDRALQAAGYSVLRFTGSEIHENAKGVAIEILDALDAAAREREE